MNRNSIPSLCVAVLVFVAYAGIACTSAPTPGFGGTLDGSAGGGQPLRLVSSSENRPLQPILGQFEGATGLKVEVQYVDSVELMRQLDSGQVDYDAVWPASTLWIALGDRKRLVSNSQSIFRSPVIFGVKRSVAWQLGWTDRDVRIADILEASAAGRLRFVMTSASQSNSGASAYVGMLYAFAGNPDILTADHLHDPAVQERIRQLLGTVKRSSGDTAALQALFLEKYADLDAIVADEATIIEINQQLTRDSREVLHAIYPVDGTTIADYPLGYIDKGDKQKEDAFNRLQAYLLADDTQNQILQLGRRAGLVGIDPENVDRTVFNPEWGIETGRNLAPIRFPKAEVILGALDLYQTTFRKGSFTVYALDYSGSMKGQGEQQLKRAMRTLLDQQSARRNLLQASPNDVTAVIAFDNKILEEWLVFGNDPQQLAELARRIQEFPTAGGTDIYMPVLQANRIIQAQGVGHRFPSIILMTDGQSQAGKISDLTSAGLNQIPVYGILFGNASEQQLNEIARYTSGRVFDGRKDLINAFRVAKGYN